MRLVRVKPSYFRGFVNSDWINMDAGLVVIYGPNGFGKTSIAEAIEWLLYGKTKRREKGENLSQRDYQRSYRNIHAPVGSSTIVEAEIRLVDGTLHNLCRELVIGRRNTETSQTFVDGNPVDFSTVGIIQEEIFYPVIAQHSLQDFIHSRPIDRRDKISGALGLDVLVRYKSIVDRGRIRFQNNPIQAVTTAKSEVLQIIRVMEQSATFRPMTVRWNSSHFNIAEDLRELKDYGNALIEEEINEIENLANALIDKRNEISKRIFKINIIKPSQDFDNLSENIEIKKSVCFQNATILMAKFSDYLNSVVTVYTLEKINFWETGLRISDSESDVCPLCGQNTSFTVHKRTEIESTISATREYKNASIQLEKQSQLTAQAISQLIENLRTSLPVLLEEQSRTILTNLFRESPEPCRIFLQVHDSINTSFNELINKINKLERDIKSIHISVRNPESIQEVRNLVSNLGDTIEGFCHSAKEIAHTYIESYNLFEPELLALISNEDAIRELDAVIEPLRNFRHIMVLSEYYTLLDDSLNLLRQIETHIQTKQNQIFASRGQEISNWYDMMNPGACVRYCRMEAGTDSITLWAQSFGVDMNAVSCLSQCQLNCLGLSVNDCNKQ